MHLVDGRGLPGKTAPVTAGCIVAKAVRELCADLRKGGAGYD